MSALHLYLWAFRCDTKASRRTQRKGTVLDLTLGFYYNFRSKGYLEG
jgi:hypothetical protein